MEVVRTVLGQTAGIGDRGLHEGTLGAAHGCGHVNTLID